jgi:uncharacterized protein (TIRG00374 family)
MKSSGTKTALSVLKIVVSLGLLGVLLSRTDTHALMTQFAHMSWKWTAAALGAYTTMLVIGAWRWRLLLQAQRVDVRLGHLTQSFLVATFFNNFLPSNIGGDVIRIADTTPHTGSKTLATTVVLVDRVVGLLALLGVGTTAAAIAASSGIQLVGVRYLWMALVVLAGGLMFALARPGVVAGIIRGLIEKSGRAATLQHRAEKLLGGLGRFREQPTSLITAFGGAVVVQALLIVFYMCAARSLSVPFPFLAACVIVPVSLTVQMMPLSINGFGVREAVFAAFFQSLGLSVSSALALSLGAAAFIMVFSLAGGVVFLFRQQQQGTLDSQVSAA